MEILDRKVMARFGQKLARGGFRRGSIDLSGLKIPKREKIEKVSHIRFEEVKLPFG
jgi:hypothetical protein